MEPSNTSSCGWMIKRCVYPSAEAVAHALAESILEQFTIASRDIGSAGASPSRAAIMLAGGRTPKAAYRFVAESGAATPSNLHFAVSDERYVPLDHPDSNALMMQPFLDSIRCPPTQRLLVDTTLSREEAARDYGMRLNSFFTKGGKLSACYLGLGSDGHTASLFSEEDLVRSKGESAISVDRPDGRIGISATPDIIRQAEKIVFVVIGEDKKDMAGNLLKAPTSIIAGRVVNRHPHVELWVDQAANPEL